MNVLSESGKPDVPVALLTPDSSPHDPISEALVVSNRVQDIVKKWFFRHLVRHQAIGNKPSWIDTLDDHK